MAVKLDPGSLYTKKFSLEIHRNFVNFFYSMKEIFYAPSGAT